MLFVSAGKSGRAPLSRFCCSSTRRWRSCFLVGSKVRCKVAKKVKASSVRTDLCCSEEVRKTDVSHESFKAGWVSVIS